MATLPQKYKFLLSEPSPKVLVLALREYGTLESAGDKLNNPTIIKWAAELGGNVANVYKADSIPWCGLFAGVIVKRAGYNLPKNPLWALSWSAWGVPVDKPMLGDVLVFTRNGGGHVAFYVGEDSRYYYCLGGNQSDSVNITKIDKKRLYCARRSPFKLGQPANVRQILFSDSGTSGVSTNEA